MVKICWVPVCFHLKRNSLPQVDIFGPILNRKQSEQSQAPHNKRLTHLWCSNDKMPAFSAAQLVFRRSRSTAGLTIDHCRTKTEKEASKMHEISLSGNEAKYIARSNILHGHPSPDRRFDNCPMHFPRKCGNSIDLSFAGDLPNMSNLLALYWVHHWHFHWQNASIVPSLYCYVWSVNNGRWSVNYGLYLFPKPTYSYKCEWFDDCPGSRVPCSN